MSNLLSSLPKTIHASLALAILLFVVVAIGITIKFVLAHPVEEDDKSCKLYEPKYYLICMNEGRGYADRSEERREG